MYVLNMQSNSDLIGLPDEVELSFHKEMPILASMLNVFEDK